jgi:hypothetical protein
MKTPVGNAGRCHRDHGAHRSAADPQYQSDDDANARAECNP